MATPRRQGWLILGCLGLTLSGCATSVSTERLGAVEVVTLRHHYNNSHLVRQGDNAFLVDAGKPDDAEALLASLRAAGQDPARLRAVIITHGHADHVGAVPQLQKLGVPIVMGRGDAPMASRGHNDPLCPTSFIARQRLDEDQNLPFAPFTPDVLVDDGSDLAELTGIKGRVVGLPGHTEGSVVVSLSEGGALVGDLFRGAIGGASAERHFYICDLGDNRRDIEALLTTIAPGATRFFTGHFGPLKREAVENLLDRLDGE